MTDSRITGSLHSADGTGTTRMEAQLDTAVEDVWAALTEAPQLATWLGDLEGDLRPGGELRTRFSATGWEGTLLVQACERPERLLLHTRADGEPDCVLELILAADGPGTRLVVEDRGVPLHRVAAYGAGDQVLVEDLVAHLAGRDRQDARARWLELHPDYQALAADLP